jgi:ATP-binding cassette subfamily B protein
MRTSWRIAPGYTVLALLLEPASIVAVIGTAVLQRALVDTRPDDGVLHVLVLAVGGGIGFAAWLALNRLQNSLTDLVNDHTEPELRAQTLRLIDDRAAFEDISDSEYADKIELLRRDVYYIAEFMWRVYGIVATLVGLGISIWLLMAIDPRLVGVAIAVALSLVVSLLAARRAVALTHDLAPLRREERYLHESCVLPQFIQETRSYDAERFFDAKSNELWRRIAERTMRRRLVDSMWSGASMVLVGAGLVFGVVLLHDGVSAGRNTVGDLVLLVTLTIGLRGQLEAAVHQLNSIAMSYSSASALAFVRSRTRPGGRPPGEAPARVEGGIEVRDLEFSYAGSTTSALQAVNVTIPRGTVLAIVGRNGAGKSTLANLLLGVLSPSRGEILIDGRPLDAEHWRSVTSGAFQDFMKPRFALREAVGLSATEKIGDDARILAAVDAAGGTALLRSLPAGLDTLLTERGGTNLSHGQWQTLALARSAMRETPLLVVLDEPTSALDAYAEHELFTSFIELGRQAGVERGTVSVVISHRYSAAYLADLILLVEDGRVIEQGSHPELMAAGGEYRRMYDLQRDAYRS